MRSPKPWLPPLSDIHCAAFDCFGTVFDASSLTAEMLADYNRHVRTEDFTPYHFPPGWWRLPAHPDSAEGIARLQARGICCVAFSNGSKPLIEQLSRTA